MFRLPVLDLLVCRNSFPKFRNQYASREPTYSGSANRSYAGRSEVLHCDVEMSTSTKYVQSGAPVVWSFVRLVGLLALEAPHRRRGVIQMRRSNRGRSQSRFQDRMCICCNAYSAHGLRGFAFGHPCVSLLYAELRTVLIAAGVCKRTTALFVF